MHLRHTPIGRRMIREMRRAPKPPTEPPMLGHWHNPGPAYVLMLPPLDPEIRAMMEKYRLEAVAQLAALLSPPAELLKPPANWPPDPPPLTFRRVPIIYDPTLD